MIWRLIYNKKRMDKDLLISISRPFAGVEPENVTRIAGGGSDREYYRLTFPDGRTAIATWGPDRSENRSFTVLSRYLGNCGISVPKIYSADEEGGAYLQEDLGDVSLYSLLGSGTEEEIVVKCMRGLARFHSVDPAPVAGELFARPFSRRQAMWDLNYFKYCFLKPVAVTFDEDALEEDFTGLADRLCESASALSGLMYRDCQSRNVMVRGGEPVWIDFQGTRIGPSLYDVASFLWQPRAGFSEDFRRRMKNIYFGALAELRDFDRLQAERDLPLFVLFRLLQVLGAYGFRGLTERKSIFLSSIGKALDELERLLDSGAADGYGELKRCCREAIGSPRLRIPDAACGLTLTVFSFSYKRGYPLDLSGNGGGFMYDCRAMHNPGRYAEYRLLTGLDREVIDFLEQRGEVFPFLDAARSQVFASAKRYLSRGFSSLQVGFGCTGGQHRSVYCAEHLAREAAEKFPEMRVRIVHREQNIEEWLNFNERWEEKR